MPERPQVHGRAFWRAKAGNRRGDGDRGLAPLTARRAVAECRLAELAVGFAAAAARFQGRRPSLNLDGPQGDPDPIAGG